MRADHQHAPRRVRVGHDVLRARAPILGLDVEVEDGVLLAISDRATGSSIAATGIRDAFGSPSVASIGAGTGVKTTSATAPALAAFRAFS